MNCRFRVFQLVALTALAGGALAEEPPPRSVHAMCADVQAILLGERIGAARVKVVEWVLAPGVNPPQPGEGFEIAGLDEHSSMVGQNRLGGGEAKEGVRFLSSHRLVCFLERKGARWYPLGAAGEGSAGLVWIEDGQCYRYVQGTNPGSYSLLRDPDCASEAALRQEIASGLADRRAWEEALQLHHPEEKAVVLASYLLARTSPEGDRGTYRSRVRQVLPKLGIAAVRELMELLRTAPPGERLDFAVLILNDLGQEAKPAIPLLLPLLQRPEQVHPVRVLEALGRIGDAAVAPAILPFLAHRELPVRAQAAGSLAAFRYQDAAEDIERCLPETVEESDAYYVYAILSALRDLDGARSARLAQHFVNDPAMNHVQSLLEPMLRE
jgi:hypothetical protein